MNDDEPAQLNHLTERIITCAIKVHRELGPGLLESVYEACLAYELRQAGLRVEQQKPVSVLYGTMQLECGYRFDMLVDGAVILEIKAIDALTDLHKA